MEEQQLKDMQVEVPEGGVFLQWVSTYIVWSSSNKNSSVF